MAYRNRCLTKIVENTRTTRSPRPNQSSQVTPGAPNETRTRIVAVRSGIARPAVGAGSGIPSRGTTTGIPSVRSGSGIPAPRMGTGIPAPRMGTGIPAARAGTGIPAARAGTGIPAARPSTGIPAARPSTGIPAARASTGIPAVRAGTGIPTTRIGAGTSSYQTPSRLPGLGTPRTNVRSALPTVQNQRTSFGGATLANRELQTPQSRGLTNSRLIPPNRIIPNQEIERISERISSVSLPRCSHSPPQTVDIRETVAIISSPVPATQSSPVNIPSVNVSPPPCPLHSKSPSPSRSPSLPRPPVHLSPPPCPLHSRSPSPSRSASLPRSPRSPTQIPASPKQDVSIFCDAGGTNLMDTSVPSGLEDILPPITPKTCCFMSSPLIRSPMETPAPPRLDDSLFCDADVSNLMDISAPSGLESSLSPVAPRTSHFTSSPLSRSPMEVPGPPRLDASFFHDADVTNLMDISPPSDLESSLSNLATRAPCFMPSPISTTPKRVLPPCPIHQIADDPDIINISQISAPSGLEDTMDEEIDRDDEIAGTDLQQTLNELVKVEEEERRDLDEDLRAAQEARRNYYIQQAKTNSDKPINYQTRVLLEHIEQCGGFNDEEEPEDPMCIWRSEQEVLASYNGEDLINFD